MKKWSLALILIGALGLSALLVLNPHVRQKVPARQSKQPTQREDTIGYGLVTNWLVDAWGHQGFLSAEGRAAIEKAGTNALPVLLALVQEGSTNLSHPAGMAAIGFEVLGRTATAAVPQLMQYLDDSNATTRAVAAICLNNIGSSAGAAVPKLVAMLKDNSPEVRLAALHALMFVPGEPNLVVPALGGFLEEPRPGPRWEFETTSAIAALRMHYVQQAAEAIPVLRQLTNDPRIQIKAEGLLSEIENPLTPRPFPGYDDDFYRTTQR